MGAEWYCKISGRALGPLNAHQLKSMAAAGQLGPTDLVRKGVSGGWAPAGDVEALPEARVIEVTDDSFDAEVLQAPEPVLIDFWAAWCPHCPPMAAICERVAAANAGRVKVVKMNVDNCRQTASKYGIRGVPTVILFHGGEVVEAYPGGRPEAALQAAIHTLIPPPEIPAETLDPEQVVEELLGFERPAAEAEFLRIELPGGAIGKPGTLDFLIPKEMIDAALTAS